MLQSPILISGPLSLGDIIDRAIRLYRAYFGPLVLTAAVLLVPIGIVDAFLTTTAPPSGDVSVLGGPENPIGRILNLYLGAIGGSSNPLVAIVFGVVNLVAYLALTFQAIALLHNRQPGLGETLSGGLSRFWTYLGNTLIMGVLIGLASLVLAIPVICIGLFGFLIVVPGVFYLMARWIVTLPLIVAEECGPIEALKRSWRLTEGMVWRSISFSLLTSLLGLIVTGLPTLTVTTVLDLALGSNLNAITYGFTNALGTLASVLWYPIAMVLSVFYYYDLRVRQEGYDLSMRIDQVESGLGSEPRIV
jgi:hypothetical protein